jgi:hypothetical protein
MEGLYLHHAISRGFRQDEVDAAPSSTRIGGLRSIPHAEDRFRIMDLSGAFTFG